MADESKNEIALMNMLLVIMQHQMILRGLANPALPAMGANEINDLLTKADSALQKTLEILVPEAIKNG